MKTSKDESIIPVRRTIMEYRHEIIDFGESIPVKFFVHQLGYSGLHWHNSLELLFVVSG